jgi:RNA polymerase sigma-70 factor (ECF subfamily)
MFFDHSREKYVRSVFNDYFQPLCEFASRLVDNTQEGEDIVIKTLHNFVKQLDASNTIDNPKAYLYRATYNACLTFIEQQHRNRSLDEGIIRYLTSQDSQNEEDEQTKTDVIQQLYIEVENLPKQYREVGRLMLKNKKTGEIAQELGLAPQTVTNYKKKIYARLRLRLRNFGDAAMALLIFLFWE